MQEQWIGQRDADSFAELVSRHAGMVYATCVRVLGDATEAEDTAQECFIALAREKTVVTLSLGAWLHAVAVHLSLNRIRADRRRRKRDARFMQEYSGDSEQEWDDIKPHLDVAIAALPDRFRVPVVQRFLEARTHEAIATKLGIGRTTVQDRIEKGVERIRRNLKRNGITLTATALSAMLPFQAAEATPNSLLTALGERAIAGYPPLSTASKAIVTGAIVMSKKTMLVSGLAALLIVGLLIASPVNRRSSPDSDRQKDTSAAASLTQSPMDTDTEHQDESPIAEQDIRQTYAILPASPSNDAAAADASDDDSKGLSPPASLSGTVLDDAAYPIADASVRLDIMGAAQGVFASYETPSADDGSYFLTDIDASGSGLASASAPGFTPHLKPVEALSAGMEQAGIDFVLSRGEHPIRGTVLDEARQPIPNARIVLLNMGYETPGQVKQNRTFDHLSLAFSEEDGTFEIFAAIPGLCDLKVEKSGYAPKAFFGIASGTEDALLVINKETGSIAGTVTVENGQPAVGYPVVVQGVVFAGGMDGRNDDRQYNLELQMAITDSRGAYRVDDLSANCAHHVAVLPTGAAQELAQAVESPGEMADPTLLAAIPLVTVEPNAITEVNLVIGSHAYVMGQVSDSVTGGPLPGIRVSASNSIGLESHDISGNDGMYRVTMTIAERTSVSVHARYIHPNASSTARNGTQTTELSPGDEKRIDFSIHPPLTIPIRAVDQDGHPLPGMVVGVGEIREGGTWNYSWPGMGRTDEDGRLACHDLDPEGVYFAWLIHSQHAALPWNQRYFDFILARSGPLMSEPGIALPEVVLVVADMGGIEGDVVGPSGEPLRNTQVTLSVDDQDGERLGARTRTDENGYFAILRAFPPARYSELELTAEANETNYRTVLNDIEVILDSVVDLGTVLLEPVPDNAEEKEDA